MPTDPRIEALQKELRDLAAEVIDKKDMPLDRVEAIEAEIAVKAATLDKIETENKSKAVEQQLAELDERFKAFTRSQAQGKAAAILAGAPKSEGIKAIGKYSNDNFLSALVNRRIGDTDAQEFVKAVRDSSSPRGSRASGSSCRMRGSCSISRRGASGARRPTSSGTPRRSSSSGRR